MDHGTHSAHHKIKAEWTRSSNEAFGESVSKISKNDKNTKVEKIKILEQIVLRPCDEESKNTSKVNELKQEPVKNKKLINRKVEESKSKKCQVCEKSFSLSNFEDHLKTHSLFECQEKDCFKKFKRKSSLRKHMYIHTGKFKYLCEDCKETFIDKCKYQVHIASKHKKIDRVYECKECDKTFTSADYLRKHQITHKDEYPYPCTVCNQKFKWMTSLQAHSMIHTQNKTMVQCKVCLKRFVNQRTLDRHMKIHQNFKYQCKLCNSVVSSRKDNIMRHIRHLHTDIPRNEISSHISEEVSTDHNKKDDKLNSNNLEERVDEIEITDDDDDESNDLIIDESIQEEPEPVIVEVQQPVINNRVNVIQSIGNPNKNQQQTPQHITASNEKSLEINETDKSTTTTQQINESSNHRKSDKTNNEIPLPPKKKAIAKYNPIEHYRKILGLSETTTSTTSNNQSEESSEPVFPDHWRKRTSQNFLFRH